MLFNFSIRSTRACAPGAILYEVDVKWIQSSHEILDQGAETLQSKAVSLLLCSSVPLPAAFQEETPAPMIHVSTWCPMKVESEHLVICALTIVTAEKFSNLTRRFSTNKMLESGMPLTLQFQGKYNYKTRQSLLVDCQLVWVYFSLEELASF